MRLFGISLFLTFLLVSCSSQPVSSFPPPTTNSKPHPTPTPLHQPTEATANCPLTAPPAPSVHNLQDLLPGCDYAAWFESNTGYEPDDSYFAGYAFLSWDTELYLGFGKARPAEASGALFARFRNHNLSAIYQPSEQGFIDMIPDWNRPLIHIPGPDPTDPAEPEGSQWDWGNTYVFDPTTDAMTKHRNLPDVIHTWGLESTPAGLYAAVSAHMGDYETWTGEVFRSQDDGETWEKMADKDDGVGSYRTYDIITFNNKLYVIWNDNYGEPCGLAASEDGGSTWPRLPEFTGYVNCRARLTIYKNQLLVLASARDGILALNPDGQVSTYIFPDFRVQDWVYHPFAVDEQERLYLVTEDNRILRTHDLQANSWETMVASDRDFITLAYWPERQQVVIGDRGVMGRVWLLDIRSQPVTQPLPPEVTIAIDGEDVVLSWSGNPSLTYRVYRNGQPDFTPPIQFLFDITEVSTWRDVGAAAQSEPRYYEVRSQNPAGDISAPSPTLGFFAFPLITP